MGDTELSQWDIGGQITLMDIEITMGVCVGELNVGAEMIRQGHAVPYVPGE